MLEKVTASVRHDDLYAFAQADPVMFGLRMRALLKILENPKLKEMPTEDTFSLVGPGRRVFPTPGKARICLVNLGLFWLWRVNWAARHIANPHSTLVCAYLDGHLPWKATDMDLLAEYVNMPQAKLLATLLDSKLDTFVAQITVETTRRQAEMVVWQQQRQDDLRKQEAEAKAARQEYVAQQEAHVLQQKKEADERSAKLELARKVQAEEQAAWKAKADADAKAMAEAKASQQEALRIQQEARAKLAAEKQQTTPLTEDEQLQRKTAIAEKRSQSVKARWAKTADEREAKRTLRETEKEWERLEKKAVREAERRVRDAERAQQAAAKEARKLAKQAAGPTTAQLARQAVKAERERALADNAKAPAEYRDIIPDVPDLTGLLAGIAEVECHAGVDERTLSGTVKDIVRQANKHEHVHLALRNTLRGHIKKKTNMANMEAGLFRIGASTSFSSLANTFNQRLKWKARLLHGACQLLNLDEGELLAGVMVASDM